ncbi:hypothetical protein JI739_17470 [Ramlibacter sp. AW1]|uniref:Uncharacterized protein n=1 Tax=Ramlibacter aurantiacus TaxID=2801330 RepID=A0A936ZJN8_9BURK|nr:hypothetical protein [Ramlibacter aurantiacus]MBL0422142.1 hypothetical protein [Ramlibacter aurantiacus]
MFSSIRNSLGALARQGSQEAAKTTPALARQRTPPGREQLVDPQQPQARKSTDRGVEEAGFLADALVVGPQKRVRVNLTHLLNHPKFDASALAEKIAFASPGTVAEVRLQLQNFAREDKFSQRATALSTAMNQGSAPLTAGSKVSSLAVLHEGTFPDKKFTGLRQYKELIGALKEPVKQLVAHEVAASDIKSKKNQESAEEGALRRLDYPGAREKAKQAGVELVVDKFFKSADLPDSVKARMICIAAVELGKDDAGAMALSAAQKSPGLEKMAYMMGAYVERGQQRAALLSEQTSIAKLTDEYRAISATSPIPQSRLQNLLRPHGENGFEKANLSALSLMLSPSGLPVNRLADETLRSALTSMIGSNEARLAQIDAQLEQLSGSNAPQQAEDHARL